MVIFTREELESFDLNQLKRLGKLYEVKYWYKLKKEDLLVALIETLEAIEKEEKSESDPPMSVRVKRIYDAQKGN